MKQRVDFKRPFSRRWTVGDRVYDTASEKDQRDLRNYVTWLEGHPLTAKHVRVVAV